MIQLRKASFALLVAVVVVALSPSLADESYRFIISGDPVAAASADSSESASSGTALVTGTLSSPSSLASLEARYRTWDESDGIALRSDKFVSTIIIVK